jgi:hypothetical protein
MDIVWLVLGGAFAAFLVLPRVIAWIATIVLAFRPSGRRASRTALSLAPFFLHSGPWLLALLIGAISYISSLARPAWLWAFIAGVAAGTLLLAGAIGLAYLRARRGWKPSPLTPERLAKMRHRHFCLNSLLFGGGLAAYTIYELARNPIDVIVFLAICLGGGYFFSWFTWQFVGASLQAREEDRQRREHKNAV